MHAEVFTIEMSWYLQRDLMAQLPSTLRYTRGFSLGAKMGLDVEEIYWGE